MRIPYEQRCLTDEFADSRLLRRFEKRCCQLEDCLVPTIPEAAGTKSKTKAMYLFFDNKISLALSEAFRNKPNVMEKHMKKAISLDKNYEALREDKFVKDLLQFSKFMELLGKYAAGWKG